MKLTLRPYTVGERREAIRAEILMAEEDLGEVHALKTLPEHQVDHVTRESHLQATIDRARALLDQDRWRPDGELIVDLV